MSRGHAFKRIVACVHLPEFMENPGSDAPQSCHLLLCGRLVLPADLLEPVGYSSAVLPNGEECYELRFVCEWKRPVVVKLHR